MQSPEIAPVGLRLEPRAKRPNRCWAQGAGNRNASLPLPTAAACRRFRVRMMLRQAARRRVATAARSEAVVRTWSAHDLLLLRVYPLAAEMGPTAGALCLRAGGTVGAVLCEDADKAVGADPYHPPPAVQCWLFSVFTGQWMGRVGL